MNAVRAVIMMERKQAGAMQRNALSLNLVAGSLTTPVLLFFPFFSYLSRSISCAVCRDKGNLFREPFLLHNVLSAVPFTGRSAAAAD